MLLCVTVSVSSINKSTIATNIYRIQVYDSVMCGYFCTGFTDIILKDKNFINLLYNFKVF